MERSRAITILTRAFHEDPLVGHLLPDPATRERWLRVAMDFTVSLAEQCGRVAVTPGGEGALLVYGPGRFPIGLRPTLAAFAGALVRDLSLRAPFAAAPRMFRMNAVFEARHPREPHHYIHFVGVEPRHQGKGFCRTLLQPTLAAADRERVFCYVENSNPRNVPMYRAFGFELVDEDCPLAGGPPVSYMRRPAQG